MPAMPVAQVVAPRRIAAKAAARRMAGLLQTAVGQDVGYSVRLDSKFNKDTSVVVVTPGVMLRWFQEVRTWLEDSFICQGPSLCS